ncbi:GlxA family transcriptional regulator [Labrys neptuniae]
MTSRAKTILFLAFDGLTDLDLVGPLQVFAAATGMQEAKGHAPIYTLRTASLAGGLIRARSGLEINSQPLSAIDIGTVDTIIVPGGAAAHDETARAPLAAWLAGNARQARRICSVCVGAFLLGHAGLLTGRSVTTHWRFGATLQRRHPDTQVCPDLIYRQDGPIWTSAGVSAGIDLALHLVEDDHGRSLAMEVARMLVVFLRRPGNQKQFSRPLALQSSDDPAFSDLIAWALDHLAGDLSVDALARRAGMSPRTFARRFRAAVGQTPAVAIEELRLDAARQRLEDSSLSLKAIATTCGFGDLQGLRRAFIRALGITPSDYRQRFR